MRRHFALSGACIALTIGIASCGGGGGASNSGGGGGGSNSGGNNSATLTVSLGGTGTGTVTSSDNRLSCGTACTASYTSGAIVSLTATPAAGSIFAGWSGGGCNGTGACSVTVNASVTVTATFANSSAGSPGSGSPTTYPTPMPQDAEGGTGGQGLVLHTVTLTTNQCLVNPNGFSISQQTTFWTTSWARYSANFWLLDATNATACQQGQAFTGYRLIAAGNNGTNAITVPGSSSYFIAIQDGGNGSNAAGAELVVTTPPSGMTYQGALFPTLTKSFNPGGWFAQPFTVPANSRIWLDGGTTGGQIYVMTPSQAATFESTYAGGYNGGSIPYVYFPPNPQPCGLNGGSSQDIPEDCEFNAYYSPGYYVLVYVNTTGSLQWVTTFGTYFH
jgi:hypothetical protein